MNSVNDTRGDQVIHRPLDSLAQHSRAHITVRPCPKNLNYDSNLDSTQKASHVVISTVVQDTGSRVTLSESRWTVGL